MGVINTKKKIPGWVRKTIRKSVAGVCIASSLIVAAIPPKISEGYTKIEGNATDYSYGIDVSGNSDDLSYLEGAINLDLKNDSTTEKYKTLYVRKAGDGSFEYGWQFEIYLQTISTTQYGVICGYNSLYSSSELAINKSLPYEYVVVTKSDYDNFYAAFDAAKDVSNGPSQISITSNGTSYNGYKTFYTIDNYSSFIEENSDEYFLKKYFTDTYNDWVNKKKAYESEYAVWNAKNTAYNNWLATDQTSPAPELPGTAPVAPEALKKYVADIPNPDNTELLKRQYYCEINKALPSNMRGYTLIQVKDYVTETPAGSITTNYIYLPQGVPNTNNDASNPNDTYGFYVKEKVDVIAIGNEAFKGTTNVHDLILSEDMKYIGDEAFADSFVRSIEFSNVEKIGNRSFKNCSQLAEITFNTGTTLIGTEAFYGCGLVSVSFPYSMGEIGPGAFANNTALATVDMSKIAQSNAKIDAFAFFNDIGLNEVIFSDTITSIGDAAFAVNMGVVGGLTEFKLPANVNPIGDYLLAGRGNLKKVVMPSNFGRSQAPAATVPKNMFSNCFQLECVEFVDDKMGASGYADFSAYTDIFKSVMNENFYVRGPENNAIGGMASPRTSTWGKRTGVITGYDAAGDPIYKPVPYVYIDSTGKEQYEISDGQYILVIDNAGVLQSCKLVNPTGTEMFTMVIPETVGSTKVTGISSDCFQQQGQLKNRMEGLQIDDNTISEIAPNAFKDFTHLKSVSIGNSVTKIGASAFEGCTMLENVSFATPAGGYASFPLENIGEKAFATGAQRLTFTGDINESYGPFVWATDINNYVNPDNGVRVCYKTGYPTYLTVLVDNRNGLPTLVNYPHYDQLNKLSHTAGDKVDIGENYILDGETHEAGRIDTDLISRYENQGKEIISASDGAVLYTYSINLQEEALVDAVLHLDIPSGIKSIDANGYINGTSRLGEGISDTTKNTFNVTLYLNDLNENPYFATYRSNGLFNGFFGTESGGGGAREYKADDPRELFSQGNDRVQSITMHNVEYLPKNAFDSCEGLTSIVLGDKLSSMDPAPFAGCVNLTSIGSSTNDFICENGIVYSMNSDGSYNIVEVLSARGRAVGSQKIKVSDEDPNLAKVSSISDGAFSKCVYISGIDFTGMNLLKEIPNNCFDGCAGLNQVILPDNITSIGHEAFKDTMDGIELVCYGKEVFLPSDAFDNVVSKRVISYSDSAVRKSAADLKADVSEVLDDAVKVQFYDFDGKELSKLIYVNVGQSVKLEDIPKDPVREGYKFAGWNKPLTNIITDTVVVATYTQDSGSISGNDSGNGNGNGNNSGNGNGNGNNNSSVSGNNGSSTLYTLTVTNGNGSGSYAEGATVIITCTNPPAGQVFDKWVPTTNDLGIASVNVAATTLKMPAHEASVTATFKAAPPSNTSGSSSVSGNNSSSNKNGTAGSTVLISKPGISNTSLASVLITGSNDNYVVRIAETAAATAAVEKALTNEYGSLDNIKYSAMDITLYDATGTNKITNYSGLSVAITIPIPDVMTQYAGNNKVAGVVNEKLDKLSPKFTTIDGVPCVTFTATHFSPYTIYVDTANVSSEAIIDGSPKTGDGIAPKWFLVAGLATLGIALFFMKDKKTVTKALA